MFYIKKGKEPRSLTVYKKQTGAYYDGFAEKDEIREHLLEEQGYLCGYCMRRIKTIHDVTIEHYILQSTIDNETALNYGQMLGVCKLNRECSYRNQTCDAHRRNKSLTVNPWNKESISLIKYNQGTGEIYSDNEQINEDLTVTLNLNCKDARLAQNRKAALSSLKEKLLKNKNQGAWSENLLRKYISMYSNKDDKGYYHEYVGILLWYLNRKLNAIKHNT